MTIAVSRSRRNLLVGAAILIAGLVLSREAFFPGFMSYDSFTQFGQSRSLRFDDWHPPLMSGLWSILNLVSRGPEGMLHFQLALLWSALFFWLWAYRGCPFAWLLPTIGLLPWVVNFAGVLWKDAGMAFALLLLAGLASWPPTRPRMALAALLFFYAVNLRYNAMFAALPLLLLLFGRWWPGLSLLRLAAAAIGTLVLALSLGSVVNYKLIGAERTRPANFMMVDDLSYLSMKEKRSLLPGVSFVRIQACTLQEISQTRLLARIFCLKHSAEAGEQDLLKADLRAHWLAAVGRDPVGYLGFRLAAFAFLLRSPADEPYAIWQGGVDENRMGVVHRRTASTALVDSAVHKTAATLPFLFKPYWWLCAASLLLAGSAALRDTATRRTAQALLASSILYILGYIPITPMADFRYVYWSVVATTLAAVLLLVDRPAFTPVRRGRFALLAAAAAVPVLLGLNAQRLFAIDADRLLLASLSGTKASASGTPVLRNLAPKDGHFMITGDKPQFEIALDGGAVAASRIGHIGFEFACLNSDARPTVRLLWWGDRQTGATDSQAVFVPGHNGLNLVRVANLHGWNAVTGLTHLRIDLFDFGACRQVQLRDVAVYG
jgi:hypothetical protein